MSYEEKPKRNRGQSHVEYLAALQGRQVTVVFGDGKALKGEMTGVDTYELFIKQSFGLEMMIRKGTIRYLHPSRQKTLDTSL
jgi:sRNA-binding regulator protein Hfq